MEVGGGGKGPNHTISFYMTSQTLVHWTCFALNLPPPYSSLWLCGQLLCLEALWSVVWIPVRTLSAWSLHVLPMLAWVASRYSSFPPICQYDAHVLNWPWPHHLPQQLIKLYRNKNIINSDDLITCSLGVGALWWGRSFSWEDRTLPVTQYFVEVLL